MSDPKDRLFRHLALLRLIPRAPKSISTTELLQRLKAEEFDIDRRTLQWDLIGRLVLDFPLLCDESQRPYHWSFPKDTPQPLQGSDLQRLRARVPDDQETLWWVFGLGESIRLHEPKHWVAVIKGALIKMAALYAQPMPHHSLTITNAHAYQEAP